MVMKENKYFIQTEELWNPTNVGGMDGEQKAGEVHFFQCSPLDSKIKFEREGGGRTILWGSGKHGSRQGQDR